MSLPVFPGSLISTWAKQGTFKGTAPTEFIRTQMDRGPARQRRVTRMAPTPVDYQAFWTVTEFELFKSFYENTLNGGASWFSVPVWLGENYVASEARFRQEYTWADDGFQQVLVSLSLEIRRALVVGEGVILALQLYGGDLFKSFADRLDPIVNLGTALPGYPYVTRNHR